MEATNKLGGMNEHPTGAIQYLIERFTRSAILLDLEMKGRQSTPSPPSQPENN